MNTSVAFPDGALRVVFFPVGEWRVGFPACRVRAVRPVPPDARADAVETVLGLAPMALFPPTHSLQLKHPDGDREILITGPVELVTLAIGSIHPVPPLLAARTRLRGLRALTPRTATQGKGVILLFDPP